MNEINGFLWSIILTFNSNEFLNKVKDFLFFFCHNFFFIGLKLPKDIFGDTRIFSSVYADSNPFIVS